LYLLKRFVLFIHKKYMFRKYCWIFASFSRYYSSTSPWYDRFGLRSTWRSQHSWNHFILVVYWTRIL